MPLYDIVVHASVDLDGATPEQAAAVFVRCLCDGVDSNAEVRGLAIWRPHDGEIATPLPPPLPDQLADFFAGVRWRAAAAEDAFRLEVEQIMAAAFSEGATAGASADVPEETEVGR
jgi:hypothetical protein